MAPRVRKACEVDADALRRFYGEAFPERAAFLAAHWRWLYRVGRFPGIEPLVLEDGGRVVGHAGAIPLTLLRLGRAAPAIWFVDFSILPELQSQGHGRALTEAWMRMCPDRVTFCNERSIKVFRKFGWREAYDASVCTLPILGGPFRLALRALALGAPRWETEPLPRDAAALSGLLDDASPAPTRIVRDEDWARWRLLDHPRSAEYRLARLDGVAAVLRLFTSSGRRRAHLLHVGPGARAKRARVVSAFARWAIEQDADRAWMATNDPALLTASVPRLPRRFALRFAWHSEDKAVSAALEAGLPTQGLDSDHDLMFPC